MKKTKSGNIVYLRSKELKQMQNKQKYTKM